MPLGRTDHSTHVSSYGGNDDRRGGGKASEIEGAANEIRAWSMKKASARARDRGARTSKNREESLNESKREGELARGGRKGRKNEVV